MENTLYIVKTYDLLEGMQVVHLVDDDGNEYTGATWDQVQSGRYYKESEITIHRKQEYNADKWQDGPFVVLGR